MKQAKFLSSRCTNLTAQQTSTAKLSAFSQKFKKTVYALRVKDFA